MLGLLCAGEEKRLRHGVEVFLNVRFYTVRLPPDWNRNRLRGKRLAARAGRLLQKRGIVRCVLPADFPYGETLRRRGVLPAETLPLLREKAADWAVAALRQRGDGASTAVVAGERLTGEMERTLGALARRVRYVGLAAPGGEEAERRLRREQGAALLRGAALERATVWLRFSGDEAPPPGACLLPLTREGEMPRPVLTLPEEAQRALPPDAETLPLLCALWRGGGLRSGQIQVESAQGLQNFS